MQDIQWPPSSNKNNKEIPLKDSSGNSDYQHRTSLDDREEDKKNTDTILKFLFEFSDSLQQKH